MRKVLVSACLAGVNCKYNGENNLQEDVRKLVEEGRAILICPEVDGGLKTPRVPAEIIGEKIITKDGKDVTSEYLKGAEIALKAALDNKCDYAILQPRSPSCGSKTIYDGTFTGTLKEGMGVTVKLLSENGIKLVTLDEFLELDK